MIYNANNVLPHADDVVLHNMLRIQTRYMPSSTVKCYFDKSEDQCDIRHWMRETVAQWMYDVCEELCREYDVFALATTILDRYLSESYRVVKRDQLQLLGASCLLIASKLKETHPLVKSTLVRYSAESFSADELNAMENVILNILKWDVHGVTGMDFVDHLLYRLDTTLDTTHSLHRAEVLHVINYCYIKPKFLRTAPSILCSAAILYSITSHRQSGKRVQKNNSNSFKLFKKKHDIFQIDRPILELLAKLSNSDSSAIKIAYHEVDAIWNVQQQTQCKIREATEKLLENNNNNKIIDKNNTDSAVGSSANTTPDMDQMEDQTIEGYINIMD